MPALVANFEYDIFISYRHNDNRSGWVTEFVNSLKEELAATIKEPISIYFDQNPHDGLLETHNVDKSLEGKLKCLIFIPIISQTYCDTKSFAWQHEFVAFNKLAKEDQFGRDIKLNNGNVASRILPIKIHDLDAEDKSLLENEIGGVLRAIDFIYKEAGVNRPLKSTDSKSDNQNKGDYRNQVNKVANAVKEIISSIKNPDSQTARITNNEPPTIKPKRNRKTQIALLSFLCVIAIIYFLYQQRTTTNEQPSQLDKSIAVLPFVDMSANHDQEYFGDGVAEEIINVLAQTKDLKVIARSSSFQFKGKNEDLRTIGNLLGVATVLEGSIRKSSDQIRVTAQLIQTSDGAHLWSKSFDRSVKDIFAVQDEIARAVALALKTTLMEGATSISETEWNEEAQKEYQIARFYFDRVGEGDFNLALLHFKRSISIDSSKAFVYPLLSVTCSTILSSENNLDRRRELECYEYLDRAFRLEPNQPLALIYNSYRYMVEYDFVKGLDEMNKALKYGPNDPIVLRNAGSVLGRLGKFNEAIQVGERAIELDPLLTWSQRNLAWSYYAVGRYDEAIARYKRARELSNSKDDFLVEVYVLNNNTQEAISENEKLSGELHDFYEILIQTKLNNTARASSLLNAFIKKEGEKKPILMAQAAAFLGKKDIAFEWLEKTYQQRSGTLTKILGDPLLKSLHGDPRYIDLVKRMNFPPN